jgi:AP endonuclease-2
MFIVSSALSHSTCLVLMVCRPVGAGYDNGRTKRPREDVNPNFRCDLYVTVIRVDDFAECCASFLWDSANSRKEEVVPKGETK